MRKRRPDAPNQSTYSSAGAVAMGIVALTLAAAGSWWFAVSRRPSMDLRRRADQNVLLVTIDTLRADALGCDGGPARTPNLDAIAASGIRFTFAHAHAVVTLPSHASLLTGTYPFQHGFRENSGYRLSAGVPTLATRLKTHGYATGAFVGAFPLDARFGLTPGFDVYDGRFDDLSGGGFIIAERPATTVVAHASAWIRAQSQRWFAWVHVYEPHAPYRPPPPFDREYADRPYYGEVAAADQALGPLFELARASTRPTLVIVTGDHGEALGDHGESTHGLFVYESTLRVPLIMAIVPAGPMPSGVTDSHPAAHTDIVPTVLDTVGLPVPADLVGHSLRTAASRGELESRASYFEAMSPMLDYGFAPLTGILLGRAKYIELPIPELYDIRADPREATNIAPRTPEQIRAMEARLSGFHAPLPGAQRPEDSEAARRLESLGYVSGGAARKTHYTERDDPKQLVEIDRRMHDAVAADEDGRTDEAIALYRQVLAQRPEMMAAARHLAFDYWRTGQASNAIGALQTALRAAPTPAGEIQLGTYLVEAGRSREALALLNHAAAADPTLDALNALGIATARGGKPSEALAVFNRSLQIDPENPMTHENIGTIYLEQGRLGEARAEFERALRSNAASAQAHAGLAAVAFKSGDRGAAIASWKQAVELDPTNWDALYDLGTQLAKDGRLAEAKPYLEQFVRSAPPSLYANDLREVAGALKALGR